MAESSPATKRVLVVEDDAAIVRLLHDNLLFEGFAVESATSGPEALEKMPTFMPDLVLLDLMLPGRSGFDICRIAHSYADRPAIIVLTARHAKDDKVRALNLGADDYVTKPFALDELLARVRAVLRRRRNQPAIDRIVLGTVVVDFRAFRATKDGEELNLRHREIELLRYLAERPGKVVTRDELLRTVWGYEYVPLTRTVDIVVARVRRKIETDPHSPVFLRTVHRDGYCLTIDQ